MKLLTRKTILLVFFSVIVLAFFLVFYIGNRGDSIKADPKNQATTAPIPGPDDKPGVISLNPADESVIPQDSVIEITFNRPVENEGELKIKFDPEIKFKKTLSQDRKTAKVAPEEPLELGTTFTMFIGPDTKFDGSLTLGEDKVYHFKTIKYRGI